MYCISKFSYYSQYKNIQLYDKVRGHMFVHASKPNFIFICRSVSLSLYISSVHLHLRLIS